MLFFVERIDRFDLDKYPYEIRDGIPTPALSVCGRGTREIRWTKYLAYFINPKAHHGLGSRLLTEAFEVTLPPTPRIHIIKSMLENEPERLLSQIPLGRFADAQEIAKVVAFISSDAGSYINGTMVEIAGGKL